jgi:hypothetical protein
MKPLILGSLFLLLTPSLRADDSSDEATAKVESRIAAIKAELTAFEDHPWAGEYYAGDGLGMNLRLWIAPKTGVAYQWHGCLGLYEQNLGTVVASANQLTLAWDRKLDDPYVTDTKWLAIPWRTRVFLVPTISVHQFCIAARDKTLLPMMALQSQGPTDRILTERPQLPPGFEKYLDLAPIQMRLLTAGKPIREKLSKTMDAQTQEVTVDAGADNHVLVGMRFEAMDPKRPKSIWTITDVSPNSSKGVLEFQRKSGYPLITPNKRWRFRPSPW